MAFFGTCESTATLNLWVLPTPFAVRKLVAPLVLWRVTPLVSWWFVIFAGGSIGTASGLVALHGVGWLCGAAVWPCNVEL